MTETNDLIVINDKKTQATCELLFPIGTNEEIKHLTMRRPTLNDTIIAEKMSDGDSSTLFLTRLSNICEISYNDLADLDELEDLENLMEAYQGLRTLPKYKDGHKNKQIKLAKNRRSIEITLAHPIKTKDQEISVLNMRRPKLKDGIDAEKESEFSTEQAAYKYASLCEVSIDVIKRLDDIDDFTSLDQAYAMFRRPKTSRPKKR